MLTGHTHARIRLDPDAFFYANDCHDVVVCAVHDNPQALCPRLWNATWSHNPVSLLHFPNAVRHAVLTTGRVAAHAMHCFFHTADTLPGSSGAPVFIRVGKRWHWVGIHSEAVDVLTTPTTSVPLNLGCSMEVALRAMEHAGYTCTHTE